MDEKTLLQAHRRVLFNCESEVVENYKKEHIAEIKRSHRKRRLTQHQLDCMHFDTFSEWFKEKVKELEATFILKNVIVLARGPSYIAKRFNAYDGNNGYLFRTKQSEEHLETQNSGVMVVSKTKSYASSSDNAPKGIMEDDLDFTVVNFSRLADSGDQERHEPFIFAEQAQQVIFVQDPQDCEWFVPRLIKPRDVFDMGEENSAQFESSMLSDSTDLAILENSHILEYENNDWVRLIQKFILKLL
ncbi:hypothetical protein RDI58_013184 [Solanum bulbocastanum]|uniref:DUF4216 domain-containing protein n=1 Tax=Solanum bulbocastanum TaxID=147425 RepID=A0AAN8YDV2_SOLBU